MCTVRAPLPARAEPGRVAPDESGAELGAVKLPVSESERFVPRTDDLRRVAAAARSCTACRLYRQATQTVFGEGRLLDEILAAAGIDRDVIYLTNAVKHFKFMRRGKKRIHDKPNMGEVRACHGWLDAELRTVHPKIILCLGATAAQAFLGPSFRLTQHLGELITDTHFAPYWMAAYHPSAILRMPDESQRHRAKSELTAAIARLSPLLNHRSEVSSEHGAHR